MAPSILIVETSALLLFLEEKLNFKFSFIRILRIMRLSVKKVELNVSEHEKITRYFFEIFANMKYTINIIVMCII